MQGLASQQVQQQQQQQQPQPQQQQTPQQQQLTQQPQTQQQPPQQSQQQQQQQQTPRTSTIDVPVRLVKNIFLFKLLILLIKMFLYLLEFWYQANLLVL